MLYSYGYKIEPEEKSNEEILRIIKAFVDGFPDASITAVIFSDFTIRIFYTK